MTAAQLIDRINHADHSGWTVPITEPVVLTNEAGSTFDFNGASYVWKGPPDKWMFLLTKCGFCTFKNLTVVADQPGVSAFDVTRDAAGGVTPTACRWDTVTVESGPNGFQYGYRVDPKIGGGGDANLDNMQWTSCSVNGVSQSMFFFSGTQGMLHSLYRSGGNGLNRTKHCIESQHTFTIRVTGGGGANLTDYAYQFGQLGAGFGEIDGAVWETCRGGLLSVPGNAVTGVVLTVKGCRYNQTGVVNVPTIAFGLQVPAVEITGNSFESDPDAAGKWSPCTIAVRCASMQATSKRSAGSVVVERNCFTTPGTLTPPTIGISSQILPMGTQPAAYPDRLRIMGNQFWSAGKYVGPVKVMTIS